MYEISIETHFSAAHRLRGYNGDCARSHGHNWVVEVFVHCEMLNNIGIGIDFKDLKQAVKDVLSKLDHGDLNKLVEFTNINPSSENIAAYIYRQLSGNFRDRNIKVSKVKISEAPHVAVCYWED